MSKNFKAWPAQWPKSQNYPVQPVYSFLDYTAARVPNRLCIIFGGMELTFSELKKVMHRVKNLSIMRLAVLDQRTFLIIGSFDIIHVAIQVNVKRTAYITALQKFQRLFKRLHFVIDLIVIGKSEFLQDKAI